MQQFSVALPAWNTRLKEHKPVCPVDGIHAADQNKTISCPNENTFCSNSVSQRYLYGKDKKIKFVIDEVGDSELEFCNTLSEIAIDDSKDNKKGNLNNKIAVIYFDGNGFGSIQAACKNEEELKAFDNTMQTKRKEFLMEFIKEFKNDSDFKNGNKLRLEILLWGGDELTFVVPAWKGLEFIQFFYNFTQNWQYQYHDKRKDLSHCGGIVFSQPKTSIHKLHDLARNLADNIKDNYKEGRENNWFDYLVLESVDYPTQSLEAFWQTKYGEFACNDRIPVKSAHKDYTELNKLTQCLPKNQIYSLVVEWIEHNNNDSQYQERLKTLLSDNNISLESVNEILNQHFYFELEKSTVFKPWAWIHFLELWDYLPLTDK